MIPEDIEYLTSEQKAQLKSCLGDDQIDILKSSSVYKDDDFFGVDIPLQNIICSYTNTLLSDRINSCVTKYGSIAVQNMLRVAITRIAKSEEEGIIETISNSVDSYGLSRIGKFGVGWFSSLMFLTDKDEKLIVETKKDRGYRITIFLDKQYMVRIERINKQTQGTKTTFITNKFNTNTVDQMIKRYQYSKISVKRFYDTKKFTKNNENIVKVLHTAYKLMIEDHGTGMDLHTIMNSLLIPTSSTKEVILSKIYNPENHQRIYITRDEYIGSCNFIIGGIIVETFKFNLIYFTNNIDIGIELYPDTKVPVTREKIIMTPKVVNNIQGQLRKLFSMLKPEETFIVEMISLELSDKYNISMISFVDDLYHGKYYVPILYYKQYKDLLRTENLYTRMKYLSYDVENLLIKKYPNDSNKFVSTTIIINENIKDPNTYGSTRLYFTNPQMYKLTQEKKNAAVFDIVHGLHLIDSEFALQMDNLFEKYKVQDETIRDIISSNVSKIYKYITYIDIRQHNPVPIILNMVTALFISWMNAFEDKYSACKKMGLLLEKHITYIEKEIDKSYTEKTFSLMLPERVTPAKKYLFDNDEMNTIYSTLNKISLFTNHIEHLEVLNMNVPISKSWKNIDFVIVNFLRNKYKINEIDLNLEGTLLSIIYKNYGGQFLFDLIYDIFRGADNYNDNELKKIVTVASRNISDIVKIPSFKPSYNYMLNDMFAATLYTTNKTFKELSLYAQQNQTTLPFQALSIVINEGTVRDIPNAVIIETLQNSYDAVRDIPNPQIDINVHITKDTVIYHIHDNGGIPDNGLVAISTPFYSSKKADQNVTGEMGTGFFVVYALAQKVVIQTTKDSKTVYIEDIPVRDEERVTDVKRTMKIEKSNEKDGTDIYVYFPRDYWIYYQLTYNLGIYVNANILPINLTYNNSRPSVAEKMNIPNLKYFEIYKFKNTNTPSLFLLNGVPFISLNTFFENKALKEVAHDTLQGYIINIRKEYIQPNTSRSQIRPILNEWYDELLYILLWFYVANIFYYSAIDNNVYMEKKRLIYGNYISHNDLLIGFIPNYVEITIGEMIIADDETYEKLKKIYPFQHIMKHIENEREQKKQQKKQDKQDYEYSEEFEKLVSTLKVDISKYITCFLDIVSKIKTIANPRIQPPNELMFYRSREDCVVAAYNPPLHAFKFNLSYEIPETTDFAKNITEHNYKKFYGGTNHSVLVHELVHLISAEDHKRSGHGDILYWDGEKYTLKSYNSVVLKIFQDVLSYNENNEYVFINCMNNK